MADQDVRRRRPIHENPAGPGEYRDLKKDTEGEVDDYHTGYVRLSRVLYHTGLTLLFFPMNFSIELF